MSRVVVVGGGFAGVAAATALAEAGVGVTLLEAHGHLGGRASSSAPTDMFPAPFDNGPHLFMGCYSETLLLLRRLGAEKEIRWHDPLRFTWRVAGGRKVSLRGWPLPAPLHLLFGLAFSDAFPFLEKKAFLDALRALSSRSLPADAPGLTVAGFAASTRQGPSVLERFWNSFTRSVVNLDPQDAPLDLMASAVRRVFTGGRFNSALGIAKRPLGDVLFPAVGPWLRERGGSLILNRSARGYERTDGGFRVRDDQGQEHKADLLIWAIPPYFLSSTLGRTGTDRSDGSDPDGGSDPSRLGKMPIVCVHALLDRDVFHEPFTGLSGAVFEWIFNRNENWGWRSPSGRGQYLSFVSSAAEDLASKKDGEITWLAQQELRERLSGDGARFEVRAQKVVREMAATPRLTSGALRFRSPALTPVPGMFLAGDWTDTGLPATIEGAALSGHQAAVLAWEHLRGARKP